MTQQQQQQQHGRQGQQSLNIEMSVDYSEEYDEHFDIASKPAATHSTPGQLQHKRPSKSVSGSADPSPASSGTHAAADAVVAAMGDAWRKAQQIATRLASAGSDEAAELVAELEAAMDSVAEVEAAASTVIDPIDHRWEVFERNSPPWSVSRADIIDPVRLYASGLDDYEPFDASGVSDDASHDLDYDDFVALLPGDPPLPKHTREAHSGATHTTSTPAVDDVGMLILPEDNAANNLALFGASTPAEATQHEHAESEWGSMLQSLLPAPIDVAGALQALAVLLAGSTLMVLVAFAFSLMDLQATAQDIQDTTADNSSADSMCSSGADTAVVHGARAARLRLHRSLFSHNNTAAVAAAFAASGLGGTCLSQDSLDPSEVAALTEPLLSDCADVEAPFLDAQQSSTLPPSVQKFFNPLHYQQLPGSYE